MPKRVQHPAARITTPLMTKPGGNARLLTVIDMHTLPHCDLQLAIDLSDLLRESISAACRSTYLCGFNSLSDFCKKYKLCPMPVDAVTLCAWMMHKCKSVKVKSVVKYTCGVRLAHILEGFEWTLTSHPLVQVALKSLKKKYPTSNTLQKIPLSLMMLIQMCSCMRGWPTLNNLSFDDLVWATASCIGFFACLRGGEFFVQPKSERPILNGKSVSIHSPPTGAYVYIEVQSPKTRKDLVAIPAMAMGTNSGFQFDPVVLLRAYRARAAMKAINILGANAAFKTSKGKPIDRLFMISRAEQLRAAAGIVIRNTAGKPIKVSAASWRAGYVMSARQAGVFEETIRSNGRWTSVGGPLPYTVDTIGTYQAMTKSLVANYTKQTKKGAITFGSGAGGHFVSSSLLL